MKKLAFSYRTVYTFSKAVREHFYTLKIYPMESERQRILSLSETISYGRDHSYSCDNFGNRTVYGSIFLPHDNFCFEVCGEVLIDEKKRDACTKFLPLFTMPSSMTKTGEALRSLLSTLISNAKRDSCFHREFPEMRDVEKAAYLSDCCYKLLEYAPDVTDIHTDAEGAVLLGKGVCQDYAHVLIALLRMVKIPARYVVGFMAGEGYTHAWVEFFAEGFWQGLDPTNSRLVDETYIKLSHGRDYNDTIVCKGHFYGNVEQTQDIQVLVKELDEGFDKD